MCSQVFAVTFPLYFSQEERQFIMIGSPETLQLSDRTSVEVGILDGDEVDSAEIIVASRAGGVDKNGEFPVMAYSLLSSKIYSICSVRKFNGEEVTPLRSELVYRTVAKRFTLAEVRKLTEWSRPHYAPADDEVKNEPVAPEFRE